MQRVILINSGTYDAKRRSPAQYGRTGVNAASYTDAYDDYAKVVSAVNRWTSDETIKCIAFQHIPLQEVYCGDSAQTSLLVNASSGFRSPAVYSGSGISGNYAASTDNTTMSGEYNEYSGCSYSSTRALYNALADKPNVVGLFFGHDHMNTLYGSSAVSTATASTDSTGTDPGFFPGGNPQNQTPTGIFRILWNAIRTFLQWIKNKLFSLFSGNM